MGIEDMKDADIKRGSATGDGNTVFALGWTPPSEQSLWVTINGVTQQDSAYTVSGSNITFATAPTTGDAIEFRGVQASGTVVTPADGSVSAAKMAPAAITSASIDYPLTTFSSTGIDDNADATCITIDSAENVGIGRVPKSWQTNIWQTLAINETATFFGIDTGTTTYAGVAENFYRDDTGYKYISPNGSAGASRYMSSSGEHIFAVAAAGAADAAITFLDTLKLDIAGNAHLRDGSSIGIAVVEGLADDAVTSFTPRSNRGMIFAGGDSTHMGAAGYVCRTPSTQETYLLLNSAGTFAVGTGVPTGTTGTDGKFNIFASSNGNIYFENRLGGSFSFWYFTMGLPW